LIGWVIDEFGRPIKYDGLIGEATIRNSGTAAATYRGITIQAEASAQTRSLIDPLPDPLNPQRLGLPFLGTSSPLAYRLITGQVTGNVTFDAPATSPGFGVSSSLILLTLDTRSNSPNYPTFVDLNFWNGSERLLSSALEFVCWGEFQLSTDIDPNLTQALMGTRKGIVQSGEAVKIPIAHASDFPPFGGNTTLLGLIETNEVPAGAPAARSFIVEPYNNGIHFWSTAFFP
jgi:hypothetical protein